MGVPGVFPLPTPVSSANARRMIFDSMANASTYRILSPRISLGLDYIRNFDRSTPAGRVAIDGDNVFALVQDYVPGPAAERVYESHRAHIDIQAVMSGEEIIGFAPIDVLTLTHPYVAEKDLAFYKGPDDWPIFLRPGDFTILFPQDGHKPGCLWRQTGPVRKIVVKIRI